jgi:hypothetical protein
MCHMGGGSSRAARHAAGTPVGMDTSVQIRGYWAFHLFEVLLAAGRLLQYCSPAPVGALSRSDSIGLVKQRCAGHVR